MEGGILLAGDVQTFASQLHDIPSQITVSKLFEHLISKRNLQNVTSRNQLIEAGIRLNYNAKDWMEVGGDPFQVTDLLNQLSELEPEKCIFRPYTRGITLRLHSLTQTERETASHQLATYYFARYERFEERLQAMLSYIHQPANSCRRMFIENYLSGRTDLTSCGMCDHCAPQYPVPWNERLVEANIQRKSSDQHEYRIDIAMIILEALRDHNGSFGLNTFIKMLLGEGFGQRRDGTKYTLNLAARNSEHFGELKHQRVKDKLIGDEIEQLVKNGHLAWEIRTKKFGQDAMSKLEDGTYKVLVLTSLGRDVLAGESGLHTAKIE